jgi:hypothetical protein
VRILGTPAMLVLRHEYFHPIMRIRKRKLENYKPVALEGYSEQEPDGSKGWTWVKGQFPALPEYILDPGKLMTVAYQDGGSVKYKTRESMSRSLCPPDILADLDRGNRIGVASKAADAMAASIKRSDGHLTNG